MAESKITKPTSTSLLVRRLEFTQIAVSPGATEAQNVSIAETGYTPIGIVGIAKMGVSGYESYKVLPTEYYISGTTLSFAFLNTASSSQTIAPVFRILYQAT